MPVSPLFAQNRRDWLNPQYWATQAIVQPLKETVNNYAKQEPLKTWLAEHKKAPLDSRKAANASAPKDIQRWSQAHTSATYIKGQDSDVVEFYSHQGQVNALSVRQAAVLPRFSLPLWILDIQNKPQFYAEQFAAPMKSLKTTPEIQDAVRFTIDTLQRLFSPPIGKVKSQQNSLKSSSHPVIQEFLAGKTFHYRKLVILIPKDLPTENASQDPDEINPQEYLQKLVEGIEKDLNAGLASRLQTFEKALQKAQDSFQSKVPQAQLVQDFTTLRDAGFLLEDYITLFFEPKKPEWKLYLGTFSSLTSLILILAAKPNNEKLIKNYLESIEYSYRTEVPDILNHYQIKPDALARLLAYQKYLQAQGQ